MRLTKESLKYRAEALRYIAFAFMSPFSMTVFLILTDYDQSLLKIKPLLFIFSCILLVIGLIFLLRGIEILETNFDLKKDD
ncbi:MAG: hypothetical protein ACOYK1_08080 [Vampirovibrionia bacterium]